MDGHYIIHKVIGIQNKHGGSSCQNRVYRIKKETLIKVIKLHMNSSNNAVCLSFYHQKCEQSSTQRSTSQPNVTQN